MHSDWWKFLLKLCFIFVLVQYQLWPDVGTAVFLVPTVSCSWRLYSNSCLENRKQQPVHNWCSLIHMKHDSCCCCLISEYTFFSFFNFYGLISLNSKPLHLVINLPVFAVGFNKKVENVVSLNWILMWSFEEMIHLKSSVNFHLGSLVGTVWSQSRTL